MMFSCFLPAPQHLRWQISQLSIRHDAFNRLPEFTLVVCTPQQLEMSQQLNQPITIRIHDDTFILQPTRISELGGLRYQFELVTPLWVMTQNNLTTVFCEQSFPSMLKTVMARYPAINATYELSGTYEEISVWHQWQCSDFDCIGQICARAGITFRWQNAPSNDLIFSDGHTAIGDRDAAVQLSNQSDGDIRYRLLPQTITVEGFNLFAQSDPFREQVSDQFGDGSHTLTQQLFTRESEAKRFANTVMASWNAAREQLSVSSTHWCRPGAVFHLVVPHHAIAIEHHAIWDEPSGHFIYQNQLTLLSNDCCYRDEYQHLHEPTLTTARIVQSLDEYGRNSIKPDYSSQTISKVPRIHFTSGIHFPLHEHAKVVVARLGGDRNDLLILAALPTSQEPLPEVETAQSFEVQTYNGQRVNMTESAIAATFTIESNRDQHLSLHSKVHDAILFATSGQWQQYSSHKTQWQSLGTIEWRSQQHLHWQLSQSQQLQVGGDVLLEAYQDVLIRAENFSQHSMQSPSTYGAAQSIYLSGAVRVQLESQEADVRIAAASRNQLWQSDNFISQSQQLQISNAFSCVTLSNTALQLCAPRLQLHAGCVVLTH